LAALNAPLSLFLLYLMAQKSILYLIALILIIGWVIGFFWFQVHAIAIHILVAISVIAAGLAFFRKNEEE